LGDLLALAAGLSVLAIPVATAIAIFRYGLYDIDLLINRTVVYGASTAAIGATFFVGIVALQSVLRQFTSGTELSGRGFHLGQLCAIRADPPPTPGRRGPTLRSIAI
jgi:hypothetical protein